MFRRDRNRGKGGGLLVYVKNTITCNLIEWSQEIDMECIGLNMSLSPQMSFTVICLYRPPSSNSLFYEHLHNILKQCDVKKELILMGDFNINWGKKTERKKLKDITNKFNLSQLIQGPTRITNTSQTQIDLIFSNRPERVTTSHNMLTGLSDHNITLLVRKLTRKRLGNSTIRNQFYEKIPKNEIVNLENAINQIDWSDLLTNRDTEVSCSTFFSTLNEIRANFTRKVKQKHGQKTTLPWLNDTLWQQMKDRDSALKRALKSGHSSDRLIFTTLRNKVLRNLRKAKADFFIRIINEAQGNGKLIWGNLNKLTGRNKEQRTTLPELKINGILTQDNDLIASTFNDFFIKSVRELAQGILTETVPSIPIDETKPIFKIKEISESEVIKIITSLRNSKAKDSWLGYHIFKITQGYTCLPHCSSDQPVN